MEEAKERPPVTKREERLLDEIDALKTRLRELEARVDAMTTGRRPEEGRIRTFVEGLDEALGGGIPRGHVVVLAGPSGSMKTSLALNLVHRNRNAGEKGLYVSLEEGRSSLLRTMATLGMETREDFIVDIGRLRTEHEAADETRDWLEILREYLLRRREKEPFGILVVDPLNALYALARMRDPRNDLFHFFNFLRSLGVTAVLIAETPEGGGPFPDDEDFLADGALQLRYGDGDDGKVDLELRCLKMRHANHRRDWLRLEYEGGRFVARPAGGAQ